MKQLFTLFLFFLSLNVFSQDTIFLKNGTKIIPDPTLHKYYGTHQTMIAEAVKVEYFLPNSRWGRSVKSKDLNYAVVGDRLIKTFDFKKNSKNKKKDPRAYYVLVETENYKLLTVYYSKNLIVPICVNVVVDKNDVIIESASYFAGGTKNDQIKKQNVAVMIRKYFSNIKEEMKLLEECRLRGKYEDISGISEYTNILTYRKY
jgi:hypothetical protein